MTERMSSTEIRRDHYLNLLIGKKWNGFIKVVTGVLRCGKSFLIFEQFKRHLLESGVAGNQIIEMVFDDPENEECLDYKMFYSPIMELTSDEGPYYVPLDEVQEMEGFEKVLNGLLRRRNLDVYVTGSNARFLSRDIITQFRGRGDEVRMRPLSFSEFMSTYDGEKSDGWAEYVQFGGIPLVVLEGTDEEKMGTLQALNRETYIRDLVERNAIRDDAEFADLLSVLAPGIGSLTNPTRMADTFETVKGKGVSPTTVRSWIGFLEDAFVIEEAQRYDIKGRKYIGSPVKYYFSDMGLRNAQIGFRQIEETHIMENVLYTELVSRGYNVDVGVINTSETNAEGGSSRKQLEVDFVCNKGSRRYYVQSAYSLPTHEKTLQEQRSLLKIDDSFKKVIVARDAVAPWYTEEGVLVTGLFDFLLDGESLERL